MWVRFSIKTVWKLFMAEFPRAHLIGVRGRILAPSSLTLTNFRLYITNFSVKLQFGGWESFERCDY